MTQEIEKPNQAGQSLMKDAWKQLRRNPIAVFCMFVLVVFALTAGYGEWVYTRYNIANADWPERLMPVQKIFTAALLAKDLQGKAAPYDVQNIDIQYSPPGWVKSVRVMEDGSKTEQRQFFLMGTDGLGRDVFLRLIQGTRIAFWVGIFTSVIAIVIGVILGLLAGYLGGWVDDIIVWLYSTFTSIPSLLFILSIALLVGKGLEGVYLGVGLTTWVGICRLVRGEVMKHRELTYVKAAQVLGMGRFRIMFRHILPNVFHIVIITFSLGFPGAVGTEVVMSFLGIGVQDQPSWGLMISESRFRLWDGVWWELTFTSMALFMVVLAFNLLGDALRDALDPRLRTEGETRI